MPTLTESLTNEAKKPAIIDDCCKLIDEEVSDKSGISGLAIKAGYGMVKGIKPGFVRQVVTDLLPEFAKALEPIHGEAVEQGKSVSAHMSANAARAADALLGITDAKAKNAKSGGVKGTYEKLRPTAKKHVEQAIPRLAKLIEKHAS